MITLNSIGLTVYSLVVFIIIIQILVLYISMKRNIFDINTRITDNNSNCELELYDVLNTLTDKYSIEKYDLKKYSYGNNKRCNYNLSYFNMSKNNEYIYLPSLYNINNYQLLIISELISSAVAYSSNKDVSEKIDNLQLETKENYSQFKHHLNAMLLSFVSFIILIISSILFINDVNNEFITLLSSATLLIGYLSLVLSSKYIRTSNNNTLNMYEKLELHKYSSEILLDYNISITEDTYELHKQYKQNYKFTKMYKDNLLFRILYAILLLVNLYILYL